MIEDDPSVLVDNDSDTSESEDAGWLDVEPDEEPVMVMSLFDTESFSTMDEMLCYCKKHHGFDLKANIRRLKLDFMGAVKLVNFIRCRVRHGQSLPDTISLSHIDDDAYLKPALDDDAVLYSLEEVLVTPEESSDVPNEQTRALLDRNRQLEVELRSVQDSFANYRLTVEETLNRRWGNDDPAPILDASSRTISGGDHPDSYFESYAAHEIHETMLKDQVRTDAYRDFIYGNKHLFAGKVILDIGCGTGILSMFCAKAGAAKVLAVDKSDIIDKARENIFNNGLSSVVTCLRGAIEDVTLPVDKVDIIVSEWMGYCLLYEAMLPSVLFARDKYLKPNGLLVPSSATLWIAPMEDQDLVEDHVYYWRDVYGFDMKAMQEGIYDEVCIQAVSKGSYGNSCPFKTLDLHSVRTTDLVFTARWESDLDRIANRIDGFLVWFDIFFASSSHDPPPEPWTTPEAWCGKKHGNVAFTTGPYGKETHWKQGLLLAAPPVSLTGLPSPRHISGMITFSVPEQNSRALMIDTSWSMAGRESSQSWKLK